ncbi:neurofilament light polypeptide-like isoform X2 [Hemiscyllium ocellatum]|uniref:neurofilament light polypeptide-like isoform X2 n=1 Tax=Hemiscyllium ocellatum TaxID=170820 RepID=UPI00296605A5|nr:neurofilament light polypeptide-like isoform X2 [Hemiscyllium ocellatum]
MSVYDPLGPPRRPWDEGRPPPASPSKLGRRAAWASASSPSPPPYPPELPQLSPELLGLRARERQQLAELNDRFAGYVERVRRLEQQNRALALELQALRERHREPPRLHALYEHEIRGLRAQLEAGGADKARMEAERERMRAAYARAKERYQEELRARLEAEERLQRARDGADRAALANSGLEAGIASLLEEMAFLRKLHGEESAELEGRLQAAALAVTMETGEAAAAAAAEPAGPELAHALRDIRRQYERLAHKNMQAAEDWYRAKFAAVSEAASRHSQAARSIRQETAGYHRLLQARAAETERLKEAIQGLHRQLEGLEERQGKEVHKYQETAGG